MKYSVIIPVYNAEKTLDRCVQSLLAQEYADAEIILINDGSKDQSGELCQNYADRYPQIKYINKENGGVSSARNAGLDTAEGEYILFVDSDDYVAEDYFAALDRVPAEWDYVVFSCCFIEGEQTSERILREFYSADRHGFFSKLSELIYRKRINSPGNKRYKRSIIQMDQIRFHKYLSIGEDALFNLRYAVSCGSCCTTEQVLYYVDVENDQSLSRKPRNDLKEQLALGEQEMLAAIHGAEIAEQDRQILLSAMNFLRVREIYSEAKRMHIAGSKMLQRLKEIHRLCDAINKKKMTIPNSRFCKAIALPVKLRLALLIDLAGWKLAR